MVRLRSALGSNHLRLHLRNKVDVVIRDGSNRRVFCYGRLEDGSREKELQEAERSYERAQQFLPSLGRAREVAALAKEPAANAELEWQEAHKALSDIQSRAHESIEMLKREVAQQVLNLNTARIQQTTEEGEYSGHRDVTQETIVHHMNFRLASFLESKSSESVGLWKHMPTGAIEPLSWLPGGWLGMQSAVCCIQGEMYLIGCICVAMSPFDTSLRSLLLHWSVSEEAGGSWLGSIPSGWHTDPSISQPCGPNAWQTNFATYFPRTGQGEGEKCTGILVHSVLLQIPMQGHLLNKGGVKFVLKRTDGSQPEWIKPSHHTDFFLDFSPVIDYVHPKPSVENKQVLDKTIAQTAMDDVFVDESDEFMGGDNIPVTIDGDFMDDDEWTNGPGSFSWANYMANNILYENAIDKPTYESNLLWLRNMTWENILEGSKVNRLDVSLSTYMHQVQSILLCSLKNLEADPALSTEEEKQNYVGTKTLISRLLVKCHELEADLKQYDQADFQARQLQLEKDSLWETYDSATKEAAKLQHDLDACVQDARERVTHLYGRQTEIIDSDLVNLCSRLALTGLNEGNNQNAFAMWMLPLQNHSGNRSLALVSSTTERTSGHASVSTSIFLEGDGTAVKEALQAQDLLNGDIDASNTKEITSISSSFDTVVVAIAFGENYPSSISASMVGVHFGLVHGRHNKWSSPPEGWCLSVSGDNDPIEDHVIYPMKTFRLVRKDGRQVLVNPVVKGICFRFPSAALEKARFQGLEFVLKTRDGWLMKEGGTNFYVNFPSLH